MSAATATAAREQRAGWRARVGLLQRRSTVARGGEGRVDARVAARVRHAPTPHVRDRQGWFRARGHRGRYRGSPRRDPDPGVVGGFGLAAARGVSLPGRRRVHCHMARRNRIPDDVGFDYDEFEDFVSTPTSQEAKEEKAGGGRRQRRRPAEEYVHISHIPAPPDPREDVPAGLRLLLPAVRKQSRGSEALAIQRVRQGNSGRSTTSCRTEQDVGVEERAAGG